MAAVPRFYKNNIAEGKGILIFAIVVASMMRLIFFLSSDETFNIVSGGYLWTPLVPLFQTPLLSLIGSSVSVALIALLVAQINTTHVLIRRRSVLPPAVAILIFSSHRSFIEMSSAYIGVLCLLFVISILFSVYNITDRPQAAFRTSFMLALGSLFSPVLLFYIPLSWLALMIMRCFSFKSLLASFLGIFCIYFPTFSFYLFADQLNVFLSPFYSVASLGQLALFSFSNVVWGAIALFVLFFAIVVGDDLINSYKDKIKVRAYLSMLSVIVAVAFAYFVLLNMDTRVNIYIMLGVFSLLYAHFFALVERKGGTILFYFSVILYFSICVLSFLSIL